MKCEDIQAVLFDYMARELGDARSVLVREHLRKCDRCQQAAADIRATLYLLRSASGAYGRAPARLSDERRRRIFHAFSHPVMHWIERHHVWVSVIVTAAMAVLVVLALRRVVAWRTEPPEGFPVTIVPLEPAEAPIPEPPGPQEEEPQP